MDAMAMALHCVWVTNSFEEGSIGACLSFFFLESYLFIAVLKCANLCGDSDSVAAVAGQIAGISTGLVLGLNLARIDLWH